MKNDSEKANKGKQRNKSVAFKYEHRIFPIKFLLKRFYKYLTKLYSGTKLLSSNLATSVKAKPLKLLCWPHSLCLIYDFGFRSIAALCQAVTTFPFTLQFMKNANLIMIAMCVKTSE